MKRSVPCLVFFILCLPALCSVPAAEASDGRPVLPHARSTPAPDSSSLVVVAQPKAVMYRLWYYHGKKGWIPKQGEPANSSHKALHGKGKGDIRTHVHPDYWNENIKAAVGTTNTMLFTVTIDGNKPADALTTTLPTFCLHECNGSWIYKTSGTDYQKLYEDELALYSGIDCRDPSETCDANASPPKYFTICAMGMTTTLGDGTVCCQSKPIPIPPEPLCLPPMVLEQTQRKHCLLGCLRGRRTMTLGCFP